MILVWMGTQVVLSQGDIRGLPPPTMLVNNSLLVSIIHSLHNIVCPMYIAAGVAEEEVVIRSSYVSYN